MDSGEVRLLVVTDRRELLELVTSALDGAGACWSAVGSPSAAVALLAVSAWDVILVDVRGHRGGCGAMVDALKRARREIKVVLMDDAPFPPTCGEDGYLETLFDPGVLVLMARELCRPGRHDWATRGRPTLFGVGTQVGLRVSVGHTVAVRGQIVAEDDDALMVEADEGWPERPVPGTPVAVSLSGADGLYVFWSTVLATHRQAATLVKPTTLERVQRRSHVRRVVEPAETVGVSVPSGVVQGRLLNESAGGAMLECAVLLKPGERVSVPLTNGEPPRAARVVWSAAIPGGGYRCGLAFVRGAGR